VEAKRSRAFTIAGPGREISQRRGSGSASGFPAQETTQIKVTIQSILGTAPSKQTKIYLLFRIKQVVSLPSSFF